MTSSFAFPTTEAAIHLVAEDGTLALRFVSHQACSVARIMQLRGQQGISERNTWAWCPDLPKAINELRDAGFLIEERLVFEGLKPKRIFVLRSKASFRGAK
jgi:hypothetical protein